MNDETTKPTSKTDWARVDALPDEEIDTSEVAPLAGDFFRRAQWRLPAAPARVAVLVDPETLAWFEAQGESAQEQMSAALRIYAEAHRAAAQHEEAA
jgi:uncharacterized protein (DUF4415 family)